MGMGKDHVMAVLLIGLSEEPEVISNTWFETRNRAPVIREAWYGTVFIRSSPSAAARPFRTPIVDCRCLR